MKQEKLKFCVEVVKGMAIIMKKICMLIIICLLFSNVAFGEEVLYDECVIYMLNRNEFLNIIENPSVERVKNSEQYELYQMKQSEDEITYICRGYNKGEVFYLYQFRDRITRSCILSYHLFELCNNINMIERKMIESGIDCKVITAVPFYRSDDNIISYSFEFPVTLCVETNIGEYFITVNEKSETSEEVIATMSEEYNLAIYSPAQYKERFGMHEGKININGILYDDEYFKVQSNNCYIPLRYVMENLDLTVNWNEEKRNITIMNNQNEVIVDLNTGNIYSSSSDYRCPYAYEMWNNRTIIYIEELKDILWCLDMNMNISLDIDNRILNITSNNN